MGPGRMSFIRQWGIARDRVARMRSRLLKVLKRPWHCTKGEVVIAVQLEEEPEEKVASVDAAAVEEVGEISTTGPYLVGGDPTQEHDAVEEGNNIDSKREVEQQAISEECAEVGGSDLDNDSECGLMNVPFVMLLERGSSELPEDVERIIFEMAAREFPSEILKTFVYVNHRVKTWVEYVLYESVILRDAKHARLFLDGLEKKNPEFIARAVKVLALPDRVSIDTSSRILGACKNIRHLSWLPTNRVPEEIIGIIAELPLSSLRARLVSFLGYDPKFSSPLFKRLTTLCIADHQGVWKKWTWTGMKTWPNLKWIAFNLDAELNTFNGWAAVRTIENKVLKPYGGPSGVRLCVCYHLNPLVTGCRWIHRTEQTFSEERMVVLSLGYRIDGQRWLERVANGCQDFAISEVLVNERQREDRRLHFALNRRSLLVQ